MSNQPDHIGQDQGQLGLHFEPDQLASSVSYPITTTFWNKYRDSFRYKSNNDEDVTQDAAVQLVIESCYHTLGEMEHNSSDTPRDNQDMDMAYLVVDELVKLVIERYR